MADDPLAGWTSNAATAVDPLAGWQPIASPPPATDVSSPPPQRAILNTSYSDVPSVHNGFKGTVLDSVPQGGPETRIRGAAEEAYRNPGIFTPEYTAKMNAAPGPFGWINRNIINPALGAAAAVPAAAGATIGELATAFGAPSLGRDINLGAPAILADIGMTKAGMAGGNQLDTPAVRALTTPVTPSLPQVLRSTAPADPVTNAAISLLRRNLSPTAMPPPPEPFKGATPPSGGLLNVVGPPSAAAPPGGLLNQPGGAPTPVMSADEILARSRGYYSPADQQIAQGATIKPAGADAVRKVLTDAIPTDPEKAAIVGNTPIVQMGNDVKPFMGQPLSFDTAISLDRQLTARKQAALRAGDNDMARQLGDAQDAVRDKMQSFGADDTTGDPAALANLPLARQAYAQYIKQSQAEDLQYNASLLPADKQDAYIRGRATAMLRGNQSRNWTDDERAAWDQVAKSGDVGPVRRLGLSLIKPVAQAGLGGIGGSLFGGPGAYVGATVGGELGANAAARLRAYLSQTTLNPVMQQITRGVPPIPPAPQGP